MVSKTLRVEPGWITIFQGWYIQRALISERKTGLRRAYLRTGRLWHQDNPVQLLGQCISAEIDPKHGQIITCEESALRTRCRSLEEVPRQIMWRSECRAKSGTARLYQPRPSHHRQDQCRGEGLMTRVDMAVKFDCWHQGGVPAWGYPDWEPRMSSPMHEVG